MEIAPEQAIMAPVSRQSIPPRKEEPAAKEKHSLALCPNQRINQSHDRPLILLRQREQLLEFLPHPPNFRIITGTCGFGAARRSKAEQFVSADFQGLRQLR
jgi:hypothetical protein